jgi:PAS domain S-box-containing protein
VARIISRPPSATLHAALAIPNSYDILQAVIEATPDAIFVKDLDGRYVLVNEAAARFLARSPAEIVGKHDLELYPEDTARQFIADDRKVLASGQPQAFEGVATSVLGTQAYLVTKGVYRDTDGKILGIYGISHDITELRVANETLAQTREALFRAQKMEAVGQLTGGIAHDFNNILVVILGNLELLRLHLPDDTYAHELIDAMLRATSHGQDLTGDLLAFSRRRQLNPEPVAINALIEDTVRLLGRTLGATIHITTATNDDVLVAMVDPAALEAAVLNVALNARDAMPSGGTLAIRTSKLTVSAPPTTGDELSPGNYAVLAFTDTGSGMPPEVVARVFEPFVTTKTGHGTGLGLSMVYGFVKQSGGTVTIESEPGRGTTVRMFFPLTKNAPSTPTSTNPKKGPATDVRTILLVEDEAAVRNTVRRQLETLGHRVLVADNARDALLLLTGPGAVDVLLTDVVLGTGINGIDLAENARQSRTGLPVIFMSGYAAAPEAQERIQKAGAPVLSKPSTLAQLERAIAAVTR